MAMKLTQFEQDVVAVIRENGGDKTRGVLLAETSGGLTVIQIGMTHHHQMLGLIEGAKNLVRFKMSEAYFRGAPVENENAASADEPALPGFE